jgi:hypothetical protein
VEWQQWRHAVQQMEALRRRTLGSVNHQRLAQVQPGIEWQGHRAAHLTPSASSRASRLSADHLDGQHVPVHESPGLAPPSPPTFGLSGNRCSPYRRDGPVRASENRGRGQYRSMRQRKVSDSWYSIRSGREIMPPNSPERLAIAPQVLVSSNFSSAARRAPRTSNRSQPPGARGAAAGKVLRLRRASTRGDTERGSERRNHTCEVKVVTVVTRGCGYSTATATRQGDGLPARSRESIDWLLS